MTALTRYQKLESPGLWRETPQAQRRDVVVALGEASLVLSDPRSDVAITHWSLPALVRTNPGHFPALYAPGSDAEEELELSDTDMIDALETVRSAVSAARARPGRLRAVVTIGLVAGIAALALFWLPGALVRHTASVLPTATRSAIGQAALGDLARVAGQPCVGTAGRVALDRLALRLFGAQPPKLVVVPDGPRLSLHLPGRIVVLHEKLIADHDAPDVVAGYAVAERARATSHDPMLPVLDHAGLRATLGLLTTGEMAAQAMSGYGEALLGAAEVPLDDSAILAAFEAAGLSTAPYAFARDASGETVIGLIEADANRAGTPLPLLSDEDWIGLRAICAN
jgi:hypothetical protein